MFRLASIIYSFVGTTIAGSAMVVALVMGATDLTSLLVAVAIGALIAVPASYLVAKRMMGN